MRDTFVRTLVDCAKEDKNIELITGDLGFGVLKPFWEKCPDQFTNAGIAEQNMTGVAAGMALTGKNVFTYSIGNFPTLRCIEQIRNDCAYHNANVKIVCIGGGFVYGSLGMSHQATEDIAILRALPGMVVMAPADLVEAEACTKALAKYNGTAYLRLGRGGEKRIHDKIDNFQIGKAIKVCDGEHVAIFSTGAIFEEVTIAKEILNQKGISPAVYTFPTVKITFGGKHLKREPEIINVSEFIAQKGYKAKGKRATTFQVDSIEFIEPAADEPALPASETETYAETIQEPLQKPSEPESDDSPTLF